MPNFPPPDDDNAPPRARWIAWLLALLTLLVVLGLLYIGWKITERL